jgi:AraC-like DNA-binding protein
MKIDTLPAITNLQSKWRTISDVDRSIAITPILAAGSSGRQLAAALGCSEALIRHLKRLAKASLEEKRQLRVGLISTREAIRHIEARRAVKARKASEAEEAANLDASMRGADQIICWFRDEEISHPYAEQIVIETRRKLVEAEMTNTLTKEKAPTDMPVAEIIRRSGLAVPASTNDLSFVERFACWLALWACYVMPDAQIRDGALDFALSKLAVG